MVEPYITLQGEFMIKYILMLMLLVSGSLVNAGECVNGNCRNFRNRTVNVTKEIINVPVTITRKTIQASRNIGRRTVNKVKNIIH